MFLLLYANGLYIFRYNQAKYVKIDFIPLSSLLLSQEILLESVLNNNLRTLSRHLPFINVHFYFFCNYQHDKYCILDDICIVFIIKNLRRCWRNITTKYYQRFAKNQHLAHNQHVLHDQTKNVHSSLSFLGKQYF